MASKGGSARIGYLPPQICKELELSFDAREIISVRPHTRGGGFLYWSIEGGFTQKGYFFRASQEKMSILSWASTI